MEVIKQIEKWVIDRNIHTQDPKVQMCKTVEELGELASALNKNNPKQLKDSIGDTVVALIAIALQSGVDFTGCMEIAYNEIKDRKGKMIDGLFVKEADLKEPEEVIVGEQKIGENIFVEVLGVDVDVDCDICCLSGINSLCSLAKCASWDRSDNKSVYFKHKE